MYIYLLNSVMPCMLTWLMVKAISEVLQKGFEAVTHWILLVKRNLLKSVMGRQKLYHLQSLPFHSQGLSSVAIVHMKDLPYKATVKGIFRLFFFFYGCNITQDSVEIQLHQE